jgi:hypothetical protein
VPLGHEEVQVLLSELKYIKVVLVVLQNPWQKLLAKMDKALQLWQIVREVQVRQVLGQASQRYTTELANCPTRQLGEQTAVLLMPK